MHLLGLLFFCTVIEIQLYSSDGIFSNFLSNLFVKKNGSLPVQEKIQQSIEKTIRNLNKAKITPILKKYKDQIDSDNLSDEQCLQIMYILEYIDTANYNVFKKNKKDIYEKIQKISQNLHYKIKEYIYSNRKSIGRKIINNIRNARQDVISHIKKQENFLNKLETDNSFIFKTVNENVEKYTQKIINELTNQKEKIVNKYTLDSQESVKTKEDLDARLQKLTANTVTPLPDDHESLIALTQESTRYKALIENTDEKIRKQKKDLETWDKIKEAEKLIKEAKELNQEIISKAESWRYKYNPFANFSDFNDSNKKVVAWDNKFRQEFAVILNERNITIPDFIYNYNNNQNIANLNIESLQTIDTKLNKIKKSIDGIKAIYTVVQNEKKRYEEALNSISKSIDKKKQDPVDRYNNEKNLLSLKITNTDNELKKLKDDYEGKVKNIDNQLNNQPKVPYEQIIKTEVAEFITQTKKLSSIGSFYIPFISFQLNELLFTTEDCYRPKTLTIDDDKIFSKSIFSRSPRQPQAQQQDAKSNNNDGCYILLNDTPGFLNYYNTLHILLEDIFKQSTITHSMSQDIFSEMEIEQNSVQNILYEPITEYSQSICNQSITLLQKNKESSVAEEKPAFILLEKKFNSLLNDLKTKYKVSSGNTLLGNAMIKEKIKTDLIYEQNNLILTFNIEPNIILQLKKTPAEMKESFLKNYSNIITILTHYILIDRLELNKYTDEKRTKLTIQNTKLSTLIDAIYTLATNEIAQLKNTIKEQANISWDEELILHTTIIEYATVFYHIIDKCILNVFKRGTFFGEYLTLEKDLFKTKYDEVKNLLTNDRFFGDKIIETICNSKYEHCINLFN